MSPHDAALLVAIQQLHSAAIIPSDNAMCTALLDQTYETSVARIKETTSSKLAPFSTDV
ncbi:hypothetical protein PF003_g15695 [Phytophthora fragariae]|nr:hypothetical protein PF003_g15695 [Phytophthora fragariae]